MSSAPNTCQCALVRSSGPFSGWTDFDDFSRALKTSAIFLPIPVEKPYSNVGLVESWYRCSICGQLWRLVEPDPPFAGLWEVVGAC